MFVPYELNNERPHCFKVHRDGDRCVCGCSAVTTSHEYPDKGYCSLCSEKRMQFVNGIVGDIDLGPQNEIKSVILMQTEQMRKFMIRERLYFIIDSHFAMHDRYSGNFVEPYDEPEFIIHCLCEKGMATEDLLKSISEPSSNNRGKFYNIVSESQIWYLSKVREMLKIDLDNKNALSATTYGYIYTRKCPLTK